MAPRNTYLYLVPGMSTCTPVLVHESSDDGMTIEHVHHSQSAVARTRHTLPRKPLVTASTAVDATVPGYLVPGAPTGVYSRTGGYHTYVHILKLTRDQVPVPRYCIVEQTPDSRRRRSSQDQY